MTQRQSISTLPVSSICDLFDYLSLTRSSQMMTARSDKPMQGSALRIDTAIQYSMI